LLQKTVPCVAEDIFSTLADKLSVDILTAAFSGLKSTSKGLTTQPKKQYYVRLKRLIDMGLIVKAESVYKLTTLGSLIFENHFKTT
jgi:predicted transcriptional regulator